LFELHCAELAASHRLPPLRKQIGASELYESLPRLFLICVKDCKAFEADPAAVAGGFGHDCSP
jgi:hypothetical protein